MRHRNGRGQQDEEIGLDRLRSHVLIFCRASYESLFSFFYFPFLDLGWCLFILCSFHLEKKFFLVLYMENRHSGIVPF